VIVQVFAAARVTPTVTMVLPERLRRVPHVEVTYPAEEGLVDGAFGHPVGTVTSTSPLQRPPVAAV
jgi:hypothetical protein